MVYNNKIQRAPIRLVETPKDKQVKTVCHQTLASWTIQIKTTRLKLTIITSSFKVKEVTIFLQTPKGLGEAKKV